MAAAGQNGSDLEGILVCIKRLPFLVHAAGKDCVRAAGRDHVILLDNHMTVHVPDFLAGYTADHTVAQRFNRRIPVFECLDRHTRNNIFAFNAVDLTNNQLLRNIDHSSCQVSGIGCSKGCIRHTLSGTVRRHEVFQHIQSLTEIRLDRQLDCASRCICHQSAHAGQLFDLLVGTTSSGIRHHEDIIVLIQ